MTTLIEKLVATEQFKKDYRRMLDFGKLDLERDLYEGELILPHLNKVTPAVFYNFVNSKGEKMRRYHYFCEYNVDNWLTRHNLEKMGTFEMFVTGAEFIKE